jgi:catechol 2,3-dioxygenase-like lactoylglutathione lyase family enzyme
MRLARFSTCLLVPDVRRALDFYVEHLGFRELFALDWFASAVRPEVGAQMEVDGGSYDLSFLQQDHAFCPAALRGRSTEALILGFVVPDAVAEAARFERAGIPIVEPLRDEVYGQRHFFARDPNGVLLDIIQQIPPDPAWLASEGLG